MAKVMTAKFAGTCESCGASIAKGEQISYNGRASHLACADAGKSAEQVEPSFASRQAAWLKEYNAGIVAEVKLSASGSILFVRNCPYQAAKNLAFQYVESASLATGVRHAIKTTRNAKGERIIGRRVWIENYGCRSIDDGFAFDLKN